MNPGLLTMHPAATALTAVMQSGGFTITASRESAFLLRDNKKGGAQVIALELDKELQGAAAFRLEPYDIVFVPKSGIAKANQAIDQVCEKNVAANDRLWICLYSGRDALLNRLEIER